MNWKNLFTWIRSLGVSVLGIAGGIVAAPAGTFDPHTTVVAAGVAAVGAGVAGLAHLGTEAVNPATWPQTALAAASVVQEVAPGTPLAKDAAAVQAAAPVAIAAIQAIQQVHADATAGQTPAETPKS